MNKKEVLEHLADKSKTSLVFSYLKDGVRPAEICRLMDINKKTLQNHLTTLKRQNAIKKIGYGCWEVLTETPQKEVLKTPRHTMDTSALTKTSFKSDSVRAHAFIFTFQLPKNFKNWDRRRELLTQMGVGFKPLGTFGGAEQIEFKGRKVWLTNRSIVIFEKSSYFGESSADTKSYAITEALETIRGIGGLLKANLPYYRFKVSRQHYALIKNALAKQYDREGNKLYVANESGFWFLIDNSFNLHEAETIHTKTADSDNKKVQDFFNGVKQYEGFTPSFVINSIAVMSEGFNIYAKNIESHIKAIQDLGEASKRNNEILENLSKKVEALNGSS